MEEERLERILSKLKQRCDIFVGHVAGKVVHQLGHLPGINICRTQSALEATRSTKLEEYASLGEVLGQGSMGKVVAAPPLDAHLSSLLNHERGAIKVCDVEGGGGHLQLCLSCALQCWPIHG
jgi:hypothetical protein